MKTKLKEQIKVIKRDTNQQQVNKLNCMILGMHGYYKIATLCNRDFADINYIVCKSLSNRLKRSTKTFKGRSKIPEEKPEMSRLYRKLYGEYTGKLYVIAGTIIFPIYGCKFQPPKLFTQEINKYTKQGRQLIHDKLINVEHLVKHLLNNKDYGESVEYNDNRISLIAGQKGKCFVTGKPLEVHNMECHHKKPKKSGGTDEYGNLVWLKAEIHKLVHATQTETIMKYLKMLKLDDKALKKVNSLRLSAENLEIMIETI